MTFPNPELYVQDSNGCCRLQSTSFDRKIFYWKNWTPCRKKSIDRHRLPVVRKDFNKSLRKPSSSHAQYVMGKIQTGFTRTARVTCSLSEHQLNVCIDSNAIKIFSGENFEDVQEILTHSRNEHFDVTVTVDEHLVYTDWEDGSINIMRGEKLERVWSNWWTGSHRQPVVRPVANCLSRYNLRIVRKARLSGITIPE